MLDFDIKNDELCQVEDEETDDGWESESEKVIYDDHSNERQRLFFKTIGYSTYDKADPQLVYEPQDVHKNILDMEASEDSANKKEARKVMARFYKSLWNFVNHKRPNLTVRGKSGVVQRQFVSQICYKFFKGYKATVAPAKYVIAEQYKINEKKFKDVNAFLHECGVSKDFRKQWLSIMLTTKVGRKNGSWDNWRKNFREGQKAGRGWYQQLTRKEDSKGVWLGHVLAFKSLYPNEEQLSCVMMKNRKKQSSVVAELRKV